MQILHIHFVYKIKQNHWTNTWKHGKTHTHIASYTQDKTDSASERLTNLANINQI